MRVAVVFCCTLLICACGDDGGKTATSGGGDDAGQAVTSDTGVDDPTGGDTGIDDPTGGDTGIDEPTGGATGIDVPPTATWHAAVRPIIEANCGQCHTDEGIGPFPLTNYDEVKAMGGLVADSVGAGRMPPWMPDPDCHPMREERILTAEQKQSVADWVADGMPLGDEADYVKPAIPDGAALGDPSLVLDAGVDYTADVTQPDDYRCLPLDHTFESDTFITAVFVKPDAQKIVHHVLLYLVEEDAIAEMDALVAKDPDTPGYRCFGGPKVGGGTLGGWVPGSTPFTTPKGSAIRIPAKSKIVMQVHYSALPLEGAPPSPDRTKIELWTLPDGETPEALVTISPLAYGGLSVEAGDPNSVQQVEFQLPISATIVGTTPHMHMLGKSIHVEVERSDGSKQCIVDVPQWDFNWQQFYLYEEGNPVKVQPGDTIRLTCTYDNSAANQPVVNGEQLEPTHVTWGDSSLDEMCLNYIITTSPFGGGGGDGKCPTFSGCLDLCSEGDGGCYVGCLIADGLGCAQCMTPKVTACGTQFCPTELAALGACLDECGDIQDCIAGECKGDLDTFYACLEPHMKGGECNTHFAECGTEF